MGKNWERFIRVAMDITLFRWVFLVSIFGNEIKQVCPLLMRSCLLYLCFVYLVYGDLIIIRNTGKSWGSAQTVNTFDIFFINSKSNYILTTYIT